MNSQWWKTLQKYFDHAVNLSPSERKQYLSLTCADDKPMLAEINTLLSAADAAEESAFLTEPALLDLFREGDEVSGYCVQRKIGCGAMGEVYLAKNLHTECLAALKCLPIIFKQDAEALKRFRHTAQLAMKLDHANICKIYEFGETPENVQYLLMEHCSEGDLTEQKTFLSRSVVSAVSVCKQLLLAMSYAHGHGVYHRDIKPTNIMFNEGTAKVVDFGLAKDPQTRLTVTGTKMGTPAYMSPEQCLGKGIDHQVDLWAIGVILYEMIAGERPFKGDNIFHIMQAVMDTQPVALGKLNATVNNVLEQVIVKALHKNKKERFESANSFIAALDLVLLEYETAS